MSRVSPLHVSNQFLALEEDGDDPEDVVGNSLDFVSVCPLGESGHMENEGPEACEEVDEGEEEASRAKACTLPSAPSLKERLQHEVTHLPYRSW